MDIKGRKRSEVVSLFVAIAIVTAFLIWLGVTNLTVWKFDAAIAGSFLFGDYVLRWLLRQSKKVKLGSPSPPVPIRLGLDYLWFFIIVITAGDIAFAGAWVTGIVYAGSLPTVPIVLASVAIGAGLALDYLENYREQT